MEFLRTTHDSDGTPKKFGPSADKYWELGPGFVGHMLDPREWMTFEQVCAETHKYNRDFDEPLMTTHEILANLLGLVAYGMVAARESPK